MKNYLKKLENEDFDMIQFLPTEEDSELNILTSKYKDPGTKLDNTVMGDCYHVILFKLNEDSDAVEHLDRYDGILTAPLEYISSLIPQNWYGVICKKTTNSNEFVNKIFATLQEV